VGFSFQLRISRRMLISCHRLEEKRKTRSEAYYQRKKALIRKLNAAKREVSTNAEELAKFGY
jgi:large subunit ribosomal protein L13Ae